MIIASYTAVHIGKLVKNPAYCNGTCTYLRALTAAGVKCKYLHGRIRSFTRFSIEKTQGNSLLSLARVKVKGG